MKTVELKDIVIGNFQYDATVNLTPEVEEEILRQGVLRVLQGKPSGDWEREILKRMFPNAKKRDEIKVVDEETGKERAFRRTDIPFSEADAAALETAYRGVEVTVGENEKGEGIKANLGLENLVVAKYEGAAKAEPKYKAAKDTINMYLFEPDGKTPRLLKTGEPRSIAAFAENRGLALPTEPWDEDSEFLAAVTAWQKAELAKQD